MDDNCPHRYWVSSEDDAGKEYCVDICDFPIGLDADGIMEFNGHCFMTKTDDGHEYHGCKDFLYRCLPRLKKEENMGRVFRCKHCRAAETYALKLLKPYLLKADPNPVDEKPY
jgi:hypothetical protein